MTQAAGATGTGTDIRFDRVGVRYPNGAVGLEEVTLDIPAGEMAIVVGLSGAGKSTLIRSINGLVPISSGQITVGGRPVAGQSGRRLRDLRSDVGMVFQSFNLARRTTVLNNVLMGRLHATSTWRSLIGAWKADDVELAMQALERVEIVGKAYAKAGELSGGQQQRVAIARALAQRPKVILADEPVASLDPVSARKVMEILRDLNKTDGLTVVVTLHQVDYALRYCDRVVALKAGKKVYDGPAGGLDKPKLIDIYGPEFEDVFWEGAPK